MLRVKRYIIENGGSGDSCAQVKPSGAGQSPAYRVAFQDMYPPIQTRQPGVTIDGRKKKKYVSAVRLAGPDRDPRIPKPTTLID